MPITLDISEHTSKVYFSKNCLRNNMEFFEKAHVAKSKNSSRKDSKSEENVKKKLKQMLYGYKQCDNDLIKNSDNLKNVFEDSSSVSGYSDLNLTNSSFDGDTTQEIVSLDRNYVSLIDESDLTMDKSKETSDIVDDDSLSIESISEYSEDIKSLSDNISQEKLDILSENGENDSKNSFIETLTDIESNYSNDDSEFDDFIKEQTLEKSVKTVKEKKGKKRKLDEGSKKKTSDRIMNIGEYKGPYRPQDGDDEVIKIEDLSTEMSSINLPASNTYKGPYRPCDKDDESFDEEIFDSNTSKNISGDSDDLSPQFVSVTASAMQSQSFSDILGEYRYPTIRNLPWDTQHVFATDNVGLFETEDVSVVDIQNDDDVGSLIPEIDNDLTLGDIDVDSIEFDSSQQPNDESTEYDNTLQSEERTHRESSTDSINPTLNIPVNVYYGKHNTCIFVLKHPAEMYIHGKVQVQSLGGTVEILGYTLQNQPSNVYAPNYNYALYVRTVEVQNACYGLFGRLTSAGLTVPEAEDIVTTLGEFDGVVSMQPLRSRQMDFVENSFNISDLFSKQTKNIENSLKKASEVLRCSLYLSKPWKCFEQNICWKQAIKCGKMKGSKGIVCGGKGMGKSTFLRYYVNQLLANGPVLVLDLDPGQCEFTVAGNVSATVVTEPLLGPNFTHLKIPELMLNVGMINTMDNPRRYAAAIQTLIFRCSKDDRLAALPWIVNTMGMTNTIGLKFMSLIILQTQPTFLLQIDSKNTKKRFDFHLYPQTIKNLYFEDYQNDRMFKDVKEVNIDYSFFLSHHTDSAVKNNFLLAPRDERYLSFLSYFGELLNVRSGDFLGIVPYEVNLKHLSIGLNVKIRDEAVTKVINGKIVALCQQARADSGTVFTLGDTPLICLGAGLIRGIDREKGVLYMVTPERGEQLSGATSLVYADWAPELRGAAAERGAGGAPLPYRATSRYQQRQLMFAPRRRFNPLRLLNMSRNA